MPEAPSSGVKMNVTGSLYRLAERPVTCEEKTRKVEGPMYEIMTITKGLA